MSERKRLVPRVQLKFTQPSRTIQSAEAECNINNIMAKYQKTGLVTHVNKSQGFYDDVSDLVDYREALDIVSRAEFLFSSVPSAIRARFDNDPAKYLAFVHDPANADELIKMGLRNPAPPEEPVSVRVINPVTDDPK